MIKLHNFDKILAPIVTEKSTILSEKNKVIFKVHNSTNKNSIKKNVEKIFKVNVIKVNIINKKGKTKIVKGKKILRKGYKKAIITPKKGQNIDLSTGI